MIDPNTFKEDDSYSWVVTGANGRSTYPCEDEWFSSGSGSRGKGAPSLVLINNQNLEN